MDFSCKHFINAVFLFLSTLALIMAISTTESLGPKLRRRRRRLGLTLDELAVRVRISKPYLSLIETGRVTNPPSDEKLGRLEEILGFQPGELLTQAHLQRTPRDVRAVLSRLLEGQERDATLAALAVTDAPPTKDVGSASPSASPDHLPASSAHASIYVQLKGTETATPSRPVDLDAAYLSGMLQQFVDRSASNVERVNARATPIINKVAAGYPTDFTDLSYPPQVADDYAGVPALSDADGFACRVFGDSMTPKYQAGDVVIFSPAATVKSGDDCFVRFEDGKTTFKRIFFENQKDGTTHIRLQARNVKYRPQLVPSEQVAGLYKAVFRYESLEGD